MFDTLDLPGLDCLTGADPPRSLAARMGAEWTASRLARQPGRHWPQYDQAGSLRLFLGTSAGAKPALPGEDDDD